MRRVLLAYLIAVSAFGAGVAYEYLRNHQLIVYKAYTVDGRHYYDSTPPNTFGPLKPQRAVDDVCGAFDTPDNFCQFET